MPSASLSDRDLKPGRSAAGAAWQADCCELTTASLTPGTILRVQSACHAASFSHCPRIFVAAKTRSTREFEPDHECPSCSTTLLLPQKGATDICINGKTSVVPRSYLLDQVQLGSTAAGQGIIVTSSQGVILY